MPRHLIVALLALCALSSPAAAQQPADTSSPATPALLSAQEYARNMQAFYDKTTDFQASFKQTYTDIAADESKESIGRVFYKRAGKLRFDYYTLKEGAKAPEREKVLVSDGNTFWVHEIAFNQVFKECVKDDKAAASLKFLMGQGDLVKEFTITLAKGATATNPELSLVPREPDSRYKELRFVLDPVTFQVLKTTIYDPYGNTNVLVFAKMLTNKGLKDADFEFKPPKNARQLNPNKAC